MTDQLGTPSDVLGGTVLLIEDDELVRDGMRLLLSVHGYYVATAANAAHGEALVHAGAPFDVVVMDLRFREHKAFDLLSILASQPVSYAPIVVTGTQGPGDRTECLTRGASFVFQKPFEEDEFVSAVSEEVRRMRRKRSVVARDLGSRPNAIHTEGPVAWRERVSEVAAPWELTPRQFDVLVAALEGFGAGQIATRLAVSKETVRTHLKHIRTKSQMGLDTLRKTLGVAVQAAGEDEESVEDE